MYRRVGLIAALAHAAIAMMSSPSAQQGVHRVEAGTKTARRIIASGGYDGRGGYIRRPLRTVAQDKRDARKARNRIRNKRAHGRRS